MKSMTKVLTTIAASGVLALIVHAQSPALPSTPLVYGFLKATFGTDGSFAIEGSGWPKLTGSYKTANGEIELSLTAPPANCGTPGKYRYKIDGRQVVFQFVSDTCMPRRMMLSDSTWRPEGDKPVI